jgi:polyhydroxyalkanoate synthase
MTKKQEKQDILNNWNTFVDSFQEQHKQMTETYFKGMNQSLPVPPTLIGDAFIKVSKSLLENPSELFKAQGELIENINDLWQKTLDKKELPEETVLDKRFHHEAWHTVPYFRFTKDYYLTMSKWLQNLVKHAEGLDPLTASKVDFFTKQFIEAVSPTNFPLTNPEVLEELVKTQGESLKHGMEKFMEDLASGKGIQLTDPTQFEIGKTLATTKGDVVFRNELMELIHYKPLTAEQNEIPLLIIPPWINKFYIFDLSPHNSFVKWMLEQGHNVFIISWINPGPELAHKSFEDYLLEGTYRAADFITSMTKQKTLHTMGYCVGGNLLVAFAAYLAQKKAPFSLQTMTLLATIIDFSKAGDLKIFMDEDHLKYIEDSMDAKGFMDAESLKSFFNMLKPNDLYWSFFIKNYLLGQVPPAFDFLYWNSDSTRLPASLHKFICRKFFFENQLMKQGKLKLNDTLIDLRAIKTPTYILSTIDDHIAPWKSSYPLTHLLETPFKFVLATSGHVAGVMNPPSKNKYAYFENADYSLPPISWLNTATQTSGSWWTNWQDWIGPQSGQKIKPQNPFYSLEKAPGSYVKEK